MSENAILTFEYIRVCADCLVLIYIDALALYVFEFTEALLPVEYFGVGVLGNYLTAINVWLSSQNVFLKRASVGQSFAYHPWDSDVGAH